MNLLIPACSMMLGRGACYSAPALSSGEVRALRVSRKLPFPLLVRRRLCWLFEYRPYHPLSAALFLSALFTCLRYTVGVLFGIKRGVVAIEIWPKRSHTIHTTHCSSTTVSSCLYGAVDAQYCRISFSSSHFTVLRRWRPSDEVQARSGLASRPRHATDSHLSYSTSRHASIAF